MLIVLEVPWAPASWQTLLVPPIETVDAVDTLTVQVLLVLLSPGAEPVMVYVTPVARELKTTMTVPVGWFPPPGRLEEPERI